MSDGLYLKSVNSDRLHNNFIEKRLSIEKKILALELEIKELQDKACTHPKMRYKYDGVSGNWDNCEFYWVDCYCPSCQKRWRFDEKTEEYRFIDRIYPHIRRIDKYSNEKEHKNFYGDWI